MKILIVLLTILCFTGCSSSTPEPVIITKTVTVNIPVKCKVEQIQCVKKDTRINTLLELIECNYKLTQANKECQ